MYFKMFTLPYTLVETLPVGIKDTERNTKPQKKDIRKKTKTDSNQTIFLR